MNILAKDFYESKRDIKISESLSLTYYRDELKVIYRQNNDTDDEILVVFFIYDNNIYNENFIND